MMKLEGSEYHRAVHNIEQGNAPKIRIDDEFDKMQAQF